jgi:hypothetical protein
VGKKQSRPEGGVMPIVSANPPPTETKAMSLDDAIFWIGVTVFGTGLYLMPEHQIWGIALIAVGVTGILYSIREHLKGGAANRKWAIIMVLSALIICAAVGYDIYDRHYYHPTFDAALAWDDTRPLERIYSQTFQNETVRLDGRHFINPTFDNVTFEYEGKGGVQLDNPSWVKHEGWNFRLGSKNKVVTMAMSLDTC